MATENLSGVLHGPENFRLEKRPVPEINDDRKHGMIFSIVRSTIYF